MYAAFELESEANFEAVELPSTDYQNIQNSKEISSLVQQSRQLPNSQGVSGKSIDINEKFSGNANENFDRFNDAEYLHFNAVSAQWWELFFSDENLEDNSILDASDSKNDDEPLDLEKVSSCSKCNLFFMSGDELHAHKSLHNCSRKFVCQPCGKICKSVRQLVSHLVEAQHGEIICSVCNFAAEVQDEMISHIQRHASDLSKVSFYKVKQSRTMLLSYNFYLLWYKNNVLFVFFSPTFVIFANLDFPRGRDGISIYQNIWLRPLMFARYATRGLNGSMLLLPTWSFIHRRKNICVKNVDFPPPMHPPSNFTKEIIMVNWWNVRSCQVVSFKRLESPIYFNINWHIRKTSLINVRFVEGHFPWPKIWEDMQGMFYGFTSIIQEVKIISDFGFYLLY